MCNTIRVSCHAVINSRRMAAQPGCPLPPYTPPFPREEGQERFVLSSSLGPSKVMSAESGLGALARTPTVDQQLIHQFCQSASSLCRPRNSSLRPQETGISVWNTQQDY
ncbi:hypothetical protein JOB18_022895 [Solea senegalensis]|uniref:Uncharacterized protein n=1 Tax=Solea senegalensis TaxID=28829 RepID=A0AAV6SD76_SOLSE|nr:hypothetical protein JOB18_022895 [Solea senegalensis]